MAHVVCFVTASSRAEARRIGDAVVEERLAACANVIGPIASTYWWKGKIARDVEVLVILKTRRDLVAKLAARVRALHAHEVPEIVALPIIGGNRAYLKWIDESVRPKGTSPRRGGRQAVK